MLSKYHFRHNYVFCRAITVSQCRKHYFSNCIKSFSLLHKLRNAGNFVFRFQRMYEKRYSTSLEPKKIEVLLVDIERI